jgi:anti-anti-sigma regulatory factor
MAIRITKISEAHQIVLHVDGYLSIVNVDELAREYESSQAALVLDLSNLLSADSEGVKCLRELMSFGAEVRGASPYIDLLLENGT